MDYLDRQKELRHHIMLMIGYLLIAVAIVMATLVLLHQAYGFGLGKDGGVIQSGLTFFSSQPSPANIYVDGKLQSVRTNTRLALPEGIYQLKLTRDGYHDWQRTINLEGGSVQHYDYPFLFPKKLETKVVQSFETAPGFMTQSPDRRWLLIQPAGPLTNFLVYDLKNPTKAAVSLSLPANILTKAAAAETWQLVEWSADSRRVLLQHNYDGQAEFVIVDRIDPGVSFNVNQELSLSPAQLWLRDKKYDRYFLYDQASGSLKTATLANPEPVEVLTGALAYKPYANNTVLFVTAQRAPQGKVLVRLMNLDNKRVLTVRVLPAGPAYLLDLAVYSGDMYMAAGSTSDDRVYIYKDPVGQRAARPGQTPVPQQVLHVAQPNHISFSSSAQFIMTENGNRFGVYDNENEVGFNYTARLPLDAPQAHASWMDGNRLLYASDGKLVVFDYDNLNLRTLVPMSSSYLPAFTPDYESVYTMAPAAGGRYNLTVTSLLAAADQ